MNTKGRIIKAIAPRMPAKNSLQNDGLMMYQYLIIVIGRYKEVDERL